VKFFIKNMFIIILCGIIILFLMFKLSFFSINLTREIILGFLLAFSFVFSGFLLFYFALKKEHKIFIRTIILSIFCRLVFILILLWLIIKFINIDLTIFLLSLFIWYFIFQILEIISFNRLVIKGS
jgi:hypothetical protein